MFFVSRSHNISNTHILPVGKTPYRKPCNTRTICTTHLQSISEPGLHSRHSFLVKLPNQRDAFFNPKTPERRKLEIYNKGSKQIIMIVLSRNSCPADSVTMFHLTKFSCGYCCVTCASFFHLASPTGFHVYTSQTGTLYTYIYIYKCVFLDLQQFPLPAAGLSSCSRLRGTQGAHPDPARNVGPWPRFVARALGVQSRRAARGGIPST